MWRDVAPLWVQMGHLCGSVVGTTRHAPMGHHQAPCAPPGNLTPLVHHLLAHRYRLPQRAIISCLLLAQLDPQPTRRVPTPELMRRFNVLRHNHLSKLLRELKAADLVEYEPGTVSDPGYLFWRVGPADPAQLRLEVAA
jgi:hypothetical protein